MHVLAYEEGRGIQKMKCEEYGHLMNKRGKDLFFVKMAKTERYKKSAIVSMQRLLNIEASKQKEIMKNISNYMPVNNDSMQSLSL